MGCAAGSATALADLHLVLARAFLAPMAPEFAHAFLHDLPEDLGEIARELPFDCREPVAAFARSVSGLGSERLLQAYSALFLQPPQRASLDASVYLDGAARGPTTLAVEARYAAYGLRPSDEVRELPDHISRLLEYSGFLLARASAAEGTPQAGEMEREARDFMGSYLRPWIPALCVEVRAACEELDLPRPYQHLAELAAMAAWEGEGWRRDPAAANRPTRTPRQALCSQCNQPYAEDAALRAVRRIMTKKALPTAHLDRCENCRGLRDDTCGTVEPAEIRAL